MRLTSFGIVLVLVTSFMAGRAGAQIPERALFQPGSYAYGMAQTRSAPAPAVIYQTVLTEVPVAPADGGAVAEADEDEGSTEWEREFGTVMPEENKDVEETTLVATQVAVPVKVHSIPYLAYHRDPITHRIHVIPYQPGYAASPEEFPEHQSKLNLLLSSLPCREQNRPQVIYAGYYDPDPEIIQDKPSRMQLLLGYPNGAWTSCCDNRWGYRMAQCPGVVPVPMGTYAEVGVKDQPHDNCVPAGPLGGVFKGPRALDYGPQGKPPRGVRNAVPNMMAATPMMGAEPCPCVYQTAAVQPGPYPRPMCPPPQPVMAAPCPEKKCECTIGAPQKVCGSKRCIKRVPCPPARRYPVKKADCSEGEPVDVEETLPEAAE